MSTRQATSRTPTKIQSSTNRILPDEPYLTLDSYKEAGGGAGLTAARSVSPDIIISEIEASGLRGRGGAGFPTGTKWRTVHENESAILHTTVVVNAAEGEPGTYKDRTILQQNPYAVLEGALIGAHAVGAKGIVIATKAIFQGEITRLRAAIDEMETAGWCNDVVISVTEGPSEYLYGEETGLLEVIDGRPPFPRIAPPYRRGVVEVVSTQAEADSESGLPAAIQMAGPDNQSVAPPVLVNNVETLANIPGILAYGATWFRELGTDDSPGTIVCTVSGDVPHPGVHEVAMGTTLRTLLKQTGLNDTSSVMAVLVGVSAPAITNGSLDVPLTHEDMKHIGSGLGSAGYIVVNTATVPLAVAAGIARFLAVESCGQCTHCKEDGGDIATILQKLCNNTGEQRDLTRVEKLLTTVAEGARCALASQQRDVVGAILHTFETEISVHLSERHEEQTRYPVTPMLSITETGVTQDTNHENKQPDWTYNNYDSSVTPVDRLRGPTETIE